MKVRSIKRALYSANPPNHLWFRDYFWHRILAYKPDAPYAMLGERPKHWRPSKYRARRIGITHKEMLFRVLKGL